MKKLSLSLTFPRTASWFHLTLILALVVPAGYAPLLAREDSYILPLYLASWLTLPFIAVIRLLAWKTKYYLQYLGGCGAAIALAFFFTLPISRLFPSQALGTWYRIGILIELLFVMAEAEKIRRQEIQRAAALRDHDISWQSQPSLLEYPRPVLLVWFILIYGLGLVVSCPPLCSLSLASGFLYLLLSIAVRSRLALDDYLLETSYISRVPAHRIQRIRQGFLIVFLLLLAAALSPAFLASSFRPYVDLRHARPITFDINLEEPPMTGPEPMSDGLLEEIMLRYAGSGKPAAWTKPASYLLITLTLAFTALLLFRMIRSRFLEFRGLDENGDLILSLPDEEPNTSSIRSRRKRAKDNTPQDKIRRLYRRTILRKRKDRPGPAETPSEIEKKAGIQDARLHEGYEEARYAGRVHEHS